MNRTFKVVFSKVRGTMVVASEAAATPHKKAAKIVIAAAAALAMGTVMAQGWADPEGIEETTDRYKTVEDLTQSQYNYVQSEGKTGFVSISTEGDHVIEGKEIWVTATGSGTQSHALNAKGTGVKLTNTGKIYIQAGKDAKSWSQKGMMAGGGATVVNEGDIVAKNAYGMTVETGVASHIENGVNGTITVLDQGAGIELGGASGSTAVNNGTINVGEITEVRDNLIFGHGVLINTSDNTFENNGTISAEGENASAIEVKGDADRATVILGSTSKVLGKIHFSNTVEDSKLIADGAVDTIDLDSEAEDLELDIRNGANITLKNGNASTYGQVNIDDGRLNASIWQDDNEFKNVTVNEDGIFNIQDLNAGGTEDQEHNQEGVTPHHTLLLAFESVYNLNGGELWVAGSNYQDKLKVGTAATSGTLNIVSGSYTYSTLEVAKKGTVNVQGGELNVTDLAFSAGKENNEGKVTVENGGSLNINGSLTAGGAAEGALTNDGILKLDYKNFFNRTEDGQGWTPEDSNIDLVGGTGVLDLTGFTESYTLERLKQIQDLFGEGMQVSLSEGTLNLEGEDLTDTKASGFYLADQVGQAGNGSFTVTDETTLGSINFGNSETASVSGAGEGKLLTLEGNGSDIFHFDPESKVNAVKATDVQLGSSASSSGNVNVETLEVSGTLNVMGNYTAQNILLNADANATVTGGLDVQTLSGEGTTTVDAGVLKVGLIESDVTLTKDATLVLGTVPPQNPNARADVDQPQVNGKVIIGGASGNDNILTTNHAAGEALRGAINDGKFGEDTEALNGFYVDKTVSVGDTGYIEIGQVGPRGKGIAVGSDVVTVVNMDAFSSGDVVFQAEKVVFNPKGTGVLANLYSTKTLTWVDGTLEAPGNTKAVFKSSNAFLDVQFKDVAADPEAGTSERTDLVVSINDDVTTDADLRGALGSVLAEGANRDNQKVLAAIGSSSSGFVVGEGNDQKLTNDGVRATKEYMVAPVTAGTYNMAYDSMELISNALIQRNLDAKKGLGVWADVFYGSNESDSLYGDSGYSSDIYGGMLGVDFGFGEGARVGAALSIGSGDGDSEDSVSKYSTDSDFWGLSVYAGKDFGGLTFTGDMSYLWLDNDIGGSVAGASASESLDSTVFSLGVRADWKAYEGKVLQVVPHAGVRWASIDVDDYRGLSMDKMNVIEMPIGVTIKGVFETASGWQVAPEIDFTAAPQIGDTEVETIIGDVDVIDNVYNASIGVNAGTDAVRFGLSYKYGFGNDGRSNNTFNLKASYLF
ncbi:autotransporter domain-containing protein [Sutterella sp. AM11-39]|uniref:autotransporter domain-containing protein n=1 Tax=Sutterella sp. AM11-39 TaxID=2292075 RepID=UPI000E535E5E|nr:autotransporter domain-containing protein [Sutterella sp. AM11-39]RHJ31791.1 autotransporter domain-containing protein [Sutterella sp. AM11-39]